MALNYVHYNGEVPKNNPLISLNVRDIEITGDLLRRKAGENENGYVLQCYAPGRARFSAQPRFHQFQYALVGINPTSSIEPEANFTFTADGDCVDSSNILTSNGADEITINTPGIYLVIYKVSRFNSICKVNTWITTSAAADTLMRSTASISSSNVQNSSCYNAEILELAEDEVINLRRTIMGDEDVVPLPGLVLEPNVLSAVPKPALACPSYIMFLQIGL